MTYLRTVAASILTGLTLIVAQPVPTPAVEPIARNLSISERWAVKAPTTEHGASADLSVERTSSDAKVVGGTETQRESALWALGRFESAGLEVPSIEILLHQVSEPCNGHRGTFSAGRQQVNVCVEDPLVMLHEIAHAWNHENLSDAQRSEYVAMGGFGSWDDPETRWFERGSEDAADTIAWALMEEDITMPTPDGPIAQANAAYRLLTGSDAPRVVVGTPK